MGRSSKTAPELSLARRIARAALATTYAGLPPPVVTKAKICLLDFLACAFQARDLPWSRQAIAIIRAASGAHVIGTDLVTTPGDAAFANGTLGHGLVREDMHAASIAHHGVVVWPTLLALAQRRPVSGAALLTAAVIGYEVGARIGRVLFTAELARLFRPTGLVAPLGAALAGSHLIGLDEDRATSAIALAANTSSGLNQWPHTGGSEMYFHPGFAARNAVTAVELAEAGVYASESILEGEAGLFAAFRRERLQEPIALFPDDRTEILAVYNKPVPACNFAQTACQAALQIAREIGDRRNAISGIVVRVPDAARRYPGCDFAGPFARALQAKMSIQFGVAAALARGVIEEANYQRLGDAETLRLVAVTQLVRDSRFDATFPAAQGAEVKVTLANGATVSRTLEDVVPATEEEIRDRFRRTAAEVVGDVRAQEIEGFVDRLERTDDAGRLAALCAPTLEQAHDRGGSAKRALRV